MTRPPARPHPTRRGLLGLGAGLLLAAGCGTGSRSDAETGGSTPSADHRRVRYGDEHGDQFADLRLPAAEPLGTIVLLHGGYWLPGYGLDLMDPLARRFTELGYATWNVEYRRTGAGGGFPATLTDVAAAVDRLAGPGLPAGLDRRVALVGHSAGGHLAAWAASRSDRTPGGEPQVRPRVAVSLAGVLDLVRASAAAGSREPVTAFMGGSPVEVPERYALADPALLVPARCPLWALHAEDDTTVPAEQSERYLARARAAGGSVERVVVPGDHFTIIDPDEDSFGTIEKCLDLKAAAVSE